MSNGTTPSWAVTPEKVEQAVRRLVETGRPRQIILFGSQVSGTPHRDSDLDILVVAEDSVPQVRTESARLRAALRGIPMCVDIQVVRQSDFERLKSQVGLIYGQAIRRGKTVYQAAGAS